MWHRSQYNIVHSLKVLAFLLLKKKIFPADCFWSGRSTLCISVQNMPLMGKMTIYVHCLYFLWVFSLLGLLFLIWHEIFFRLLQSLFLKQCALSLNQAHQNQIVSMKSSKNKWQKLTMHQGSNLKCNIAFVKKREKKQLPS